MKKLKIACLVFGLLHAAVMTMFALGPELSPLVVWIVDAPVATFTIHASSPFVKYGVPIIVCSILYSLVIFLIGWLGMLIHRRRSARILLRNVL